MEKSAETDDNKIREAMSGAKPETRGKVEKKIFGIQPVADLHNYTLVDYMKMHGLTDEDIQAAVKMIGGKGGSKKSSGGGGKRSDASKKVGKDEALTKRQLAMKLIRRHYQAVKEALDAGINVSDNILSVYPDLAQNRQKPGSKTDDSKEEKPRKPMSEETKKKISDALKQNKPEEVKEEKKVEDGDSAEIGKIAKIIAEKTASIQKLNSELKELGNIPWRDLTPQQNDRKSTLRELLRRERTILSVQNELLRNLEQKIHHKAASIESKEFTSPAGTKVNALDFTAIDHTQILFPKQNEILDRERPTYIPAVDEKKLAAAGYTLPFVQIGPDQFLVDLDNVRGTMMGASQVSTPPNRKYAVMTLDLYTTTLEYYKQKGKAEMKLSVKKDQERLDKLYGEGKYKAKNTRIKLMGKNKMSYNQMYLIQEMIPKPEGKMSRYHAWEEYRKLQKLLGQKITDLELQREYIDNSFSKGQETSYGDSGTKDNLLKSHGVKVKRQNGDEITDKYIKDIETGMNEIFEIFGKTPEMNRSWGLKISHSGNVLMHARKAVGLFHPAFNAIGVSEKKGFDQFTFTFAHEYAHFMDYMVGKNGMRSYASDVLGSTANDIASTFRNNMNEVQTSKYMNRTCECFARAFEQYFAWKSGRNQDYQNTGTEYKDIGFHVSQETMETKIAPLIEKFIAENKHILKAIDNDLQQAYTVLGI